MLQIQPFPIVEQAYAQVRREDLRQSVMMMNEDTISGGAMLSRGDINLNTNYLFKRHQMESLTQPQNQSHKEKEEAAQIMGIQNTPKKHVSNYMVIQIGGMNSRQRKNVKQVEATILVM